MPFSRKDTRELDALAQWQIEEIKKALDEADRGEFASDEEVEQVLERWTRGIPQARAGKVLGQSDFDS